MPPISALWGGLTPTERRLLLSLTRSPSQLQHLLWWHWALRDLPLARRVIVPPAPERWAFARWLADSGRLKED